MEAAQPIQTSFQRKRKDLCTSKNRIVIISKTDDTPQTDQGDQGQDKSKNAPGSPSTPEQDPLEPPEQDPVSEIQHQQSMVSLEQMMAGEFKCKLIQINSN